MGAPLVLVRSHGVPEHLGEPTLDKDQRRLRSRILSGPRADFLATERSAGGWALPGPFGPMLLAPNVGEPLQELGVAVRYRGRLDDATRELAIVATAAACGSRYELDHHLPLARAAAVPGIVLQAIVDEREVPDPVVQACRQLTRSGSVHPSVFSAVEAALGRAEAFELLVLAGYYRLLATMLATYGIV